MTVLQPPETITFNVLDPTHRLRVHTFFTEGTWGPGPKFTVPSEFSNIVDYVRNEMVHYYMSLEFKRV